MTFTRIVIAAGVVLLGFLCFLAAIGMTVVTEGLVTVFALVVLIAGGNLLAGRGGAYGRAGHGGGSRAPMVTAEGDGGTAGAATQDAGDRPEHGET